MYELWFRREYLELIQNKSLLTAVRPGDRRHPRPKSVSINQMARVRIIESPGSEADGIMPTFLDFSCFVKITNLFVDRVCKLTTKGLIHCSPDSQTPNDILDHLEKIYQKKFSPEDVVTILHWKYF